MFQALRLADFLIVYKVPVLMVGKIAVCLLLSASNLILPIAFLASVIIGLSRLSADSELIAMKASGISTGRMLRPVLALAIVVCLFSLLLGLEIVPWGDRTLSRALRMAGARTAVSSIKSRTFREFYDLMLYTEEYDSKTGKMRNVFLFDQRNPDFPVTVVSKRGELFRVDTQDPLMDDHVMRLEDGAMFNYKEQEESYDQTMFERYRVYLKMEGRDVGEPNLPRMASSGRLLAKMRSSDSQSWEYRDFGTEFWKRISVALSPLMFCILGVGVGSFRMRSGRSAGMLVTFLVMLGYWVLLSAGIKMSHHQWLPMPLALQVPNLILGAAGWIIYRRAAMW